MASYQTAPQCAFCMAIANEASTVEMFDIVTSNICYNHVKWYDTTTEYALAQADKCIYVPVCQYCYDCYGGCEYCNPPAQDSRIADIWEQFAVEDKAIAEEGRCPSCSYEYCECDDDD